MPFNPWFVNTKKKKRSKKTVHSIQLKRHTFFSAIIFLWSFNNNTKCLQIAIWSRISGKSENTNINVTDWVSWFYLSISFSSKIVDTLTILNRNIEKCITCMSYGVKIALKLNNCIFRSNVTGNKQSTKETGYLNRTMRFGCAHSSEYDDTVASHWNVILK